MREVVKKTGGRALDVKPGHGLLDPDGVPEGGLIELFRRSGAVAVGVAAAGWWGGHRSEVSTSWSC